MTKINISGAAEDSIYKNRQFIQELELIQQTYFETLVEELWPVEGLDKEEFTDFLFEYLFNHTEEEGFGEYLEGILS